MPSTPEKGPEKSARNRRDGRGRSPGSRTTQFGQSGAPRPQEPPPAVPPPEGVPQQLADMRHVAERPSREDCTPGHRTCRKWLRSDLPGFMRAKSQLEAKLVAQRPAARSAPDAAEEHDAGTERALSICESTLAGYAKQQAAEDAELATRPQAAELGRTRQKDLLTALERERQLSEQLAANRTPVEGPHALLVGFLDDYHEGQRAEDAALAARSDPASIIGSLAKALEGSRWREQVLKGRLQNLAQ